MATLKEKKQKPRPSRKQSLPLKRRDGFLARPEDLYVERRPGHRHYDLRSTLPYSEATVLGIIEHGVLMAVIVEKCGDKIAVVDGRQRVSAAVEANVRIVAGGGQPILIPVVPKRGGEIRLFEAGIICNEHRRAEGAVSQAYKIQHYLDMGHNRADCAKFWSVDERTISNRLSLLELCVEVQEAITNGRVTITAALKLRGLCWEAQREWLHAPKVKSRAARPSVKRVKKLLGSGVALSEAVLSALRWAGGEITDEEAGEHIEGFAEALGGKSEG